MISCEFEADILVGCMDSLDVSPSWAKLLISSEM